MLRCVLVSLALATFAHAQNPPGYSTAFAAAKDRGLPLVIFVACEGREVDGAQCMECSRYPGAAQPVIVVGDVETLACKRLPPSATDAEIRAAFPIRNRAGVREYASNGRIYREYYTAPTPVYVRSPYSTPGYYSYSPLPGAGLYGGVQIGTYGSVYGGACVGGNCPTR